MYVENAFTDSFNMALAGNNCLRAIDTRLVGMYVRVHKNNTMEDP
jgi:hypothetical protein